MIWPAGPTRPTLGSGEIHVWRFSLDQPREIRSGLSTVLDAEERQRASRFATDRLQKRYVVGRGMLRRLLSSYLDIDAEKIRFRYGEHGKPFLAGGAARSGLQFNLSHSRDLALLAFCPGSAVGVDVEWIRHDLKQTEIASRFFSAAESARLVSLPPDRQIEFFFTLWTCKEAFVKAQGGGVTFGLDRFDVELQPSGATAVIAGNRGDEDFDPWLAYLLHPGRGYAGALAVRERELEISTWNWSGDEGPFQPASSPHM